MPNQFQAGSAIQVTLSLPRRAPPASSLGEVQSGAWCGTWYPLCICLSFCDFCLLNVEPIGLVSSSVSQNHRIIVYQCVSIFHHEETNFIRSQTARGCASMRSPNSHRILGLDQGRTEKHQAHENSICGICAVCAEIIFVGLTNSNEVVTSAELGRIQKNNAEI